MKKNITITRNNAKNVTLRVMDTERASMVADTDTIYFTAKPQYDNDETDSAAAIAKTLNAGDVLDRETGEITFKLTSSDMNVLPRKYVYDVVLEQEDTDRATLLEGKLTVGPAATLRGINGD